MSLQSVKLDSGDLFVRKRFLVAFNLGASIHVCEGRNFYITYVPFRNRKPVGIFF